MHGKLKILFELLVITAAAYFLADACRVVFFDAGQADAAVQTVTAAPAAPKPVKPKLSHWAAIEGRNLLKAAAPKPPEKKAPPQKKITDLPISKLNIRLLGTIQGTDPALSRAIILQGKRQSILRIGEKVAGYDLAAVHRRAVELRKGSGRELLVIDGNDAETAQRYKARTVSLSRRKVSGAMKDIGALAREVSLRPSADSGRKGLLITRLKDSSLLHDIGLRQGDMLIDAGGRPLRSLADLGSLASLMKEKRVSLNILRDSAMQTLTVDLVP